MSKKTNYLLNRGKIVQSRSSAFSFAYIGPKEKAQQKEKGREISRSAHPEQARQGDKGYAPLTSAEMRLCISAVAAF
ncbi:MAG: hypothetical protein ACI3XR_00275 [Eubacteriales bacterium]